MKTNQSTMNLKLKRIDVCDILLALLVTNSTADQRELHDDKWMKLHDKIRSMLDKFDEE